MESYRCFACTLMVGMGAVVFAGCVSAAAASSGYVGDSRGKVVTSNFGECVQSDGWNKALSTPECDAELAARLEAERLESERLAAEARAAEEARRAAELALLNRPAVAPTLLRLSDKRNVMFEFNSAALTPAATGELDKVMSKIREFDQIDAIEIVGHTDSSGPESYNQVLSERRANSIRQFLESRGVSAALLSARGVGESSPVETNATREGRAMNRRVDILVSGNAAE